MGLIMINRQNISKTRKSYFYTVLFLNDYYPTTLPASNTSTKPETKIFDITETSNSSSVKWLPGNKLWVRHNLPLPITLEMWDETGKPIIYVPILKDNIDSITIGNVVCEGNTSIVIDFTGMQTPLNNKTYKLAVRSLPLFDLEENNFHMPTSLPVDQKLTQQTGLAIIFRRHSMDALFDLIAEFDESYWHSMAESFDLQYLTKQSCYKNAYFSVVYTNDLQDAMDLIDVSTYDIKYSWENNNPQRTNQPF